MTKPICEPVLSSMTLLQTDVTTDRLVCLRIHVYTSFVTEHQWLGVAIFDSILWDGSPEVDCNFLVRPSIILALHCAGQQLIGQN